MVDREARDQMAVLLRRLASGRINVSEFDTVFEALPLNGQDRIVEEIAEVIETGSIKSIPRRDVARWILFLQSGAEYGWPEWYLNPYYIIATVAVWVALNFTLHNSLLRALLPLFAVIIFTKLTNRQNSQIYKSFNLKVWPFLHQADLDEAKLHPRLLNGKQ